jgi:hypothetical protein
LNPKYPGGIPGLKRKLSAEGHKVVQKGKRFLFRVLRKISCIWNEPGNKPALRQRPAVSGITATENPRPDF